MGRKRKQTAAIIQVVLGLVLIAVAMVRAESRFMGIFFTWRPLNKEHAAVCLLFALGIFLLLLAVINFLAIAASHNYTDKHLQDINQRPTSNWGVVCRRCGSNITVNSNFCTRCGTAVNEPNQPHYTSVDSVNRSVVQIPINSNNYDAITGIVAQKLQSAGYMEKLVDGERAWVKGDGVLSAMICINLIFGNNYLIIQGWTKGSGNRDHNLDGFSGVIYKNEAKKLISEICQIIQFNNL